MSKFISRKLLVTIGSMLTVVLSQIGLPEDVAAKITDALVYLGGAYLVGQGVHDAAGAARKG